jgi:hypothetical protein
MLHDPVHRWVGGNMGFASSPNDPVFFLHHCYLDLLWERWKHQHPTIEPYLPQIGWAGLDRARRTHDRRAGLHLRPVPRCHPQLPGHPDTHAHAHAHAHRDSD